MAPKKAKKTKEEIEAERIAAEKAAKKAEAEAQKAEQERKKAEEKARKKREKEEKEAREGAEEEERKRLAEEARLAENSRLAEINRPIVEAEWDEKRRIDRITHLKHSISALLQSTFDHLNQKEQLMELAASEYERNSELHSTLHRDHLARVESLFALHERAIQIELDHFQQIEGRQLVELFTKSAKRARDWRSAKLDAMRDQHAAWKMDWDVQGVQQDDEWSAKFQERRESLLQIYHTTRLSHLSHLHSLRSTALSLSSDHESAVGNKRHESLVMRSKLDTLEKGLEESLRKEEKVKMGINLLGDKLRGAKERKKVEFGKMVQGMRGEGMPPSLKKRIAGGLELDEVREEKLGDLEIARELEGRRGEGEEEDEGGQGTAWTDRKGTAIIIHEESETRFDDAEFDGLKRQVAEVVARNEALRKMKRGR